MKQKIWILITLLCLALLLCAAANADEPVLILDEYNEEQVELNDDGSVSVPMHQWINFAVSAPGSDGVSIYCLDDLDELDDLNDPDEDLTDKQVTDCWPGDGWEYFTWTPNDLPGDVVASYDKYIVAQAHYNNWTEHQTASVLVHVSVTESITGSVTFTVPEDVNVIENDVAQVARDGRFFVDVNNSTDADFYGLYIAKDSIQASDHWIDWIADSHWVAKSGGQTTRVPLTIPRCVAGQEYEVHVYAIKFGAPQIESADTATIYVTAAEHEDCPVTVSMGGTYTTGEPLWVYAHYSNPDNIYGWMNIRIYNVDNPDDVIYDAGGDFTDFWDMDTRCWHSGHFVVDAEICRFGENGFEVYAAYPGIKTFAVEANGQVTYPDVNEYITLASGEDLVLTLSAQAGTDTLPAERFQVELVRIDWGWEPVEYRDVEAEDGEAEVTIDGKNGYFEAGGQYLARIHAVRAGANSASREFRFVVTSPDLSQNLTLTVNGHDQDLSVPSSSNLRVKVAYEDEDRPTVIRILNGDHCEYWWGEDNYERDWSFGDGELIMYAEASWEAIDFDELGANDWKTNINGELVDFDWNRDVQWSGKSNVIHLDVISPYGTMIAPEYTIDNDDTELDWGEDLLINIADEAPMAVNGEGQTITVPNGWFFCNIDVERRNEDGYTWWDRVNYDYGYSMHGGTNHIPTYNLEENCRYRIEIGADAVGYSGRSNWKEFTVGEKPEIQETIRRFTINGESGSVTVKTGIDVQLEAYHSDAEWYNVEIRKQGEEDWHDRRDDCRSGMLLDHWRGDESGFYTMTAYAYGYLPEGQTDEAGNDFWEDELGTVTVEVTSVGRVAAISVNDITTLVAGDDLTLNISAIPGEEEDETVTEATSFGIELARIDRGWEMLDRLEFDSEDGTALAVFPADNSYFETGGQYQVRISAYRPECDMAYYEFRFVVIGSNMSQELTLTVDGHTGAYMSVPSSYGFKVKVAYEDRPTVVRILNGDHWEYWWGNNDNYERDWSFGDGEILLYAEGSWEEIDFDELEENDWKINMDGEMVDFEWDRDVYWGGRSNTIRLDVISPYGKMIAPEYTIENENASLAWGEDLIINISDESPRAINGEGEEIAVSEGWFFCHIDVERGDEDGTWWERVNHNYDYHVHSGLNHIPTFNMEENCRYRIEIGADAEGYAGRSGWQEFALGEKSEGMICSFTVNGGTADLTVQTTEDLRLTAYRSNAEWYNVVITRENDDGWRDDLSNSYNGMLLENWCANNEGVYTFTAYAYGHLPEGETDEEGNDFWEELIGSITVTVTAEHGDLTAPDADVTDKAYVGDRITIHFNETENAEEYSYWIHSAHNNEWITGNSRRGAGDLILDTSRLWGAGVYWVELDVMAPGYNQAHSTLHFALLDRNHFDFSADDNSYYFSASGTELQTTTNVLVVAYIPGAEAIQMYSANDNDAPQAFEYCEGPGTVTSFSRGESGDYRIYLSGLFDGNWSELREVTTISVTAEHGPLSLPNIEINGSVQGMVVPAQQDNPDRLSFEIFKVQNAEYYHLEVRQYGDGWAFVNMDLNASDDKETISYETGEQEAWMIRPGVLYEVTCDVAAKGYESQRYVRTFLLQEGEDDSVTLEVSPRDTNEGYWTAQNVWVYAEAEGATALKVCMNNEVRWYRGDRIGEDFTIWDPNTIFYAYATEDPIPDDDVDWHQLNVNWSRQAIPVPVYAQTEGDTLVPTLTFNNHVTKGDWFEFTIEDDGDARQMDIRIRDNDGREYEFRRLWMPGTYRITTTNLEAGQTYWVNLSCVQDKHLWTEGPWMSLYVDEPAEDTAFFRVDKNRLYPNEPFIPTVHVPGAVRVKITSSDDSEAVWGEWDGENGTNDADWEWWYDQPGNYGLTAWALYTHDGEWEAKGTIAMTVLESEQLEQAEITVPNEADVTDYIDIYVDPVEYGYYYTVQLHYTGQDPDEWHRWTKSMKEIDPERNHFAFTIDPDKLIANKSYWIDCYVDPAGRDYAHCGSESSKNIMTINGEANYGGISVSLDGDWEQDEESGRYLIPVHAGFDVTVTAGPAAVPSAIAVYLGDQVDYRFFEGPVMNFGMSEHQAWPEIIFARAYYDDLSMYSSWEDVPWADLEWGNASNAIPVTFFTNGQAEPAQIDNYDGIVMIGDDIVVHVTPGTNANEAHANLDRNIFNWEEELVFADWFGWDPDTQTITIPTIGIEPGTYRLYVDNSGEGYDNSRSWVSVNIVEDPYQSGLKLELPSDLREIGEEAFAGVAAETVIIPDEVTRIGRRAFADSEVLRVVIPASVTEISWDAFEGSNLWVVYGYSQLAADLADDYQILYYDMGK